MNVIPDYHFLSLKQNEFFGLNLLSLRGKVPFFKKPDTLNTHGPFSQPGRVSACASFHAKVEKSWQFTYSSCPSPYLSAKPMDNNVHLFTAVYSYCQESHEKLTSHFVKQKR